MANRLLSNRIYSAKKDRKLINARVVFGVSGAPTLDVFNSPGIASVTRASVGKFVFTFGYVANNVVFRDAYHSLVDLNAVFDTTGAGAGLPASPSVSLYGNASSNPAVATLSLQFTSLAGALADPANGEVGCFDFAFGDSTAV